MAALGPGRAPESQEGDRPALLSPEEIAQRVAERFGVDPDTVRLGELVGEPYMRYPHTRLVAVDEHDPPLALGVDATNGRLFEVRYRWADSPGGAWAPPEGASREPVLDPEQARQLAVDTAELCFDGVPGGYEVVRELLFDSGATIRSLVEWRRREGGILLPDRLSVHLDALKGRPYRAVHVVYPVTVPLEAKVTREEAIATAGEAVQHLLREGEILGPPKEVGLEVHFGLAPDRPSEQQFAWAVLLIAAGREPRPVARVTVDARSGAVLGVFPFKTAPREAR